MLFSSSVCSAGMLCINLFSHSALLFLFLSTYASALSVLLLCFYSFTLHICSIFSCASSSSLFLQFHSFSLAEKPTVHTVCFIFFYTHEHDGSTSQLLRQNRRQLSKQLKHQLIGNHESISLTDL
jgi:hypothetical protein